MNMKKLMFGALLVVVSMLFAGCSEEAVSKEDLLKYPQGVQDGKISVAYYDELREYEKTNLNYMKYVINNDDLLSDENIGQSVKHFNEYQEFLQGLEFNPETKADKSVATEIAKVNKLMHDFNDNYLKMIDIGTINDEFIRLSDDNGMITQQMMNYKIEATKILEDNGVDQILN